MNKYSINISWSIEDDCYVALVPEFPNLSAFGETAGVAVKEAEIALQGFIDIFKEEGLELPKPHFLPTHSGQLRVRIPKDLHATLAKEAERCNVSLNTKIVSRLSEKNISGGIEDRLDRIENRLKSLDSQVCSLLFSGTSDPKPKSNLTGFTKLITGSETGQPVLRIQ